MEVDIQEVKRYLGQFHRRARWNYGLKIASRWLLFFLPVAFLLLVGGKLFPQWESLCWAAVLGVPLLFFPLCLYFSFSLRKMESAAVIDVLLHSEERLATFAEVESENSQSSSLSHLAKDFSRFLDRNEKGRILLRIMPSELRALALLYPCILLLFFLPSFSMLPAGQGSGSSSGGTFVLSGDEVSSSIGSSAIPIRTEGERRAADEGRTPRSSFSPAPPRGEDTLSVQTKAALEQVRKGPLKEAVGTALKNKDWRKSLQRLSAALGTKISWKELQREIETLRRVLKKNKHLEGASLAAEKKDAPSLLEGMAGFLADVAKSAAHGESPPYGSGEEGGLAKAPASSAEERPPQTLQEAREKYVGREGGPAPLTGIRWSPAYNEIVERYFSPR